MAGHEVQCVRGAGELRPCGAAALPADAAEGLGAGSGGQQAAQGGRQLRCRRHHCVGKTLPRQPQAPQPFPQRLCLLGLHSEKRRLSLRGRQRSLGIEGSLCNHGADEAVKLHGPPSSTGSGSIGRQGCLAEGVPLSHHEVLLLEQSAAAAQDRYVGHHALGRRQGRRIPSTLPVLQQAELPLHAATDVPDIWAERLLPPQPLHGLVQLPRQAWHACRLLVLLRRGQQGPVVCSFGCLGVGLCQAQEPCQALHT
mmetsp:Transcript_37108/g.104736  ORF Transcript_37108/g.104736 Transcript_37108/m.104736 type:complete len:254 (-) Transcript_37108:1473-2234(-)